MPRLHRIHIVGLGLGLLLWPTAPAAAQNLPPKQTNVESVASLELVTPLGFRTTLNPGPIAPNQIADVTVHNGFAYLNSAREPTEADGTCKRGGFFSVDLSNPSAPVQRAFVPALPQTYHGEGLHATTLETPFFTGDVLAVNNEECGPIGTGGFDLYDITNPAAPVALKRGAGDFTIGTTTQSEPNSTHSIFVWQDGAHAYAVAVDNEELHDVDIFDITNPRAPVLVDDFDLVELGQDQGVEVVDNSARGDEIFAHDMIVKEIGGVQTMLVSYWDAGYVKLDVDDPANPTVVGDSAYRARDPIFSDPATGMGFEPPEGNAHQAEFSFDNRFILGADQDLNPLRGSTFDGWGYSHLFGAATLGELDTYAIPEAQNPGFASGFGALSVHEFATDPTEYLAYTSYYAGGMRVFSFGPGGIVEQGAFVDAGGSDLWGVEQFTTTNGERLFAGSDRDFGLYLFRYTGPGAAKRPQCLDGTISIPFKTWGNAPLECTDANGNPLSRFIVSPPSHGSLGAVNDSTGSVPYYGDGRIGTDIFEFKAYDGAAYSSPVPVLINIVPREGGYCFNQYVGTPGADSINGSRFGDSINLGPGNDIGNGGAGFDCLDGGPGKDRLRGGGGTNVLDGGSGADVLIGSNGRYWIFGGLGNDNILGGARGDIIDVGLGSNRVRAGRGNDQVRALNGRRDRIDCGSGRRDKVWAERTDVTRNCERIRRR